MASCAEQHCTEQPRDYVRFALSTELGGSMTVEVLLCELHIASAELANKGNYLFIRPRQRLDM